ncbi:MAG: Uma2 family endonuclease [Acidobacteria bacterium]|nr:Uma2 family endonuclease [Acidobacteriota bacterium]
MAAHTQISPEEYLRTSFDGPDRDYLDGEIVERNVGENPHSKAQVNLVLLLHDKGKKTPLHVRTELRMQVTPTRFRVADVAVYSGEEPKQNVPSSPPLITIEILSRDDRYSDILQRFEDYGTWGVRHIWFVDPWLRKIHVYEAGALREVPAFRIPEYELEISPAEIFG